MQPWVELLTRQQVAMLIGAKGFICQLPDEMADVDFVFPTVKEWFFMNMHPEPPLRLRARRHTLGRRHSTSAFG